MSENSQQPIYNDFFAYVNRMKAELASVDVKYSENDDGDACAKYREKLHIYQRYTDDLISKGFQYLDVIEHLKKELATNDASSVSSSSSVCEETVCADINFIRKCLESRTGMEEKAFDSLIQVQGVVDTLLKDYCGLIKKNHHLNEQLKNFRKSPPPPSSSSCGHADHIAELQRENDSLKEKINRISKTSNRPCESCDIRCNNNKRLNDCESEIELLKQQLAKKDKTIEKLLFMHRNQSSSLRNCGSMESTSSDTVESNLSIRDRCLHRTRSDGCASYRSCGSNNLSESEKRDIAKIKALKNGYKELTKILKEKYDQLRTQRAKIDELMKQLEDVTDLECALKQLRREKEHLENQIKNMPNNVDALNKLKRQIEKCDNEVERLRRREHILTRKVASQDELLRTLSAERENLMKINDKMKRSICLCGKELRQYCD